MNTNKKWLQVLNLIADWIQAPSYFLFNLAIPKLINYELFLVSNSNNLVYKCFIISKLSLLLLSNSVLWHCTFAIIDNKLWFSLIKLVAMVSALLYMFYILLLVFLNLTFLNLSPMVILLFFNSLNNYSFCSCK